MPDIPRHLAVPAAAIVLACCVLTPRAAHADADAIYAEAAGAFKAGDYKKAAKSCARGIELSREARFLYLRARAVWELGDYEEAWSLMNLVKPNELPAEQQEPFVADYARMEVEAKAAREKTIEEVCCPNGVGDCANDPRMTCRHPECVEGRCVAQGKPTKPGSSCSFDGCPGECVCAGPGMAPEEDIGNCIPKSDLP